MGGEGKAYTSADVSQHNNTKDCWLVIGGKVVHPFVFGNDATDDFEDVGHSSSATAMLDEFYVGDIDTSTVPTKTKYTPPKQPHYD
ncbi:Cytochrome b5 [Hibiscus syriacus]|uniref:Cytochrome b5 n=1 Tax=Hibiscus syriacus TaxID=106335 RepID=A0A6A2YZZ7_HIBSY|nr:Cytochrome b5 [Hibiscus syriacus]